MFMRNLKAIVLLSWIALSTSCGTIPPYSSVNKQPVTGFYTFKAKTAAFSGTDLSETNTNTNIVNESEISDTNSYAIEIERIFKEQISTTFSIHKREYNKDANNDSTINGNQIHIGVRRYFGDRALTGFLALEGIYTFNFNDPEEDLDYSSGPGWALGAGINFALDENTSLESSLFYESIMPANSYSSGDTSSPSEFEHSLKGVIAYIGLGYHF